MFKSLTYVRSSSKNQICFPLCYTVKAFLNAYIFTCLNLNRSFWSRFHDGFSHFWIGRMLCRELCSKRMLLNSSLETLLSLMYIMPMQSPVAAEGHLSLGYQGHTRILLPGVSAVSLRSVWWLLLQSAFQQYLKMQFITIEGQELSITSIFTTNWKTLHLSLLSKILASPTALLLSDSLPYLAASPSVLQTCSPHCKAFSSLPLLLKSYLSCNVT